MPELPEAMAARFVSEYGVTLADATQLTADRGLAAYYEATVTAPVEAKLSGKLAANWLLGEFAGAVNRADIVIDEAPIPPLRFARLLCRVEDGTISGKIAKEVFDAMWAGESEGDADAIIAARGLRQISDEDAISRIVDDVIAANAAIVAEFRAGKAKAFNALVGKAMAATGGKANPAQVNAVLKRKLDA
jgi:aspartyl-tRNA(Asn)/glutamyl-tRNA(Gln) amidotransferase subunit B